MKPYLLTINTLKTNNPSFECLLYLLYSEGVAPGYSDTAFQANGFPSSGWILAVGIFIFAIGHFTKRYYRYFLFEIPTYQDKPDFQTFSIEPFSFAF